MNDKKLWSVYNIECRCWEQPEEMTREEAISIARQLNKDQEGRLEIGKCEFIALEADAECELQYACSQADDFAGEHAEDWIEDILSILYAKTEKAEKLYDDLQTALTKALNDWIENNDLTPRFFRVFEIEEVVS